MNSCVFCKILTDEIDASFIYRGETCSVFLDIHPMTPGHLLIVPNQHSERFADVSPEEAADMFKLAHSILKAVRKTNLACEGANIFLSDGTAAGQEVPHSHLHLAPRFHGDGQRVGFVNEDPDEISRTKLDEIAQQIAKALSSSN